MERKKKSVCKECGRQICPAACPEFSHVLAGKGGAECCCRLCGGAIYPHEGYYRRGDVAVCLDCVRSMTVEELGQLLGTDEALLLCGFEKIW